MSVSGIPRKGRLVELVKNKVRVKYMESASGQLQSEWIICTSKRTTIRDDREDEVAAECRNT